MIRNQSKPKIVVAASIVSAILALLPATLGAAQVRNGPAAPENETRLEPESPVDDRSPATTGQDPIEHYLVRVSNFMVHPGQDPRVPDFNDGSYLTLDLVADVADWWDWEWTVSSARAVIAGDALFFAHPLGNDTPPLASDVAVFPAWEFDSFYLATEPDYWNQPPYKDPSFAENVGEPQYREATWFDTPPNGGAGCFTIARYTVMFPDESGGETPVLDVEVASDCYPFGCHDYLTVALYHPADISQDGRVDHADLGILLSAWDTQPGDDHWNPDADIDADGHVGHTDLGILLSHWGYGT